jgi:hypothetical protein
VRVQSSTDEITAGVTASLSICSGDSVDSHCVAARLCIVQQYFLRSGLGKPINFQAVQAARLQVEGDIVTLFIFLETLLH